MTEIRGRRRPDPPTSEDTAPLLSPPPSILRQNSSCVKKVQFHPSTVFHCRHLRYRRARLRTFGMLLMLGAVVLVSFWMTYGFMSEHQAKIAKEGLAGLNADHGGESWGKVRPGALGSFRDGSVDVKHSAADTKDSVRIETKSQVKSANYFNSAQPKPKSENVINADKCQFRTYPSNRLYGLPSTNQPNFLSEAIYIRGRYPIILNPATDQRSAAKLCINTTSWENLTDSHGNERLPFTDGHNPSMVSLNSTPYGDDHVRIDHQHLRPIASATAHNLNSLHMAITVFGSGQCKFGLSSQDIETYRFSAWNEVPNGKRAVISVHSSVDTPFQTILQSTLLLERDAKYGTNRRAVPEQKNGEKYARVHQEFDDPRFFFHNQRLWVLYRNGPLFGYNDQIHNPVHFEMPSEEERKEGVVDFVAYVKASETVRVCCGRNIALISEESGEDGVWAEKPTLRALSWVDPVTVVDVNLDNVVLDNRRLEEASSLVMLPLSDNLHRRLKSKDPKSHIHGTNGYMIPLSFGELLGIAHFHRPEDRKSSEYALHGHHYTHVFFTISKSDGSYKLKRLSNEFMFQAQYSPLDDTKLYQDGDVIQFASGLDLIGSDKDGTLIISYGINDCEGAVFTIPMERLNEMLIEVQPGQEVVDLMSKVE